MCTIDDLTVDATIHGKVLEVPSYKGDMRKYIAGQFREPHPDAIFCSEHGYVVENMTNSAHLDINEIVKGHLEENK